MNQYEKFYCPQAHKLACWALGENMRVKATKIMRVAQRLEHRFRSFYIKSGEIRFETNILIPPEHAYPVTEGQIQFSRTIEEVSGRLRKLFGGGC